MITRFQIEDYGCIRKVDFALTPLHAFIGPNDSGKSTILRAMHQLVQTASGLMPVRGNTLAATFAGNVYSTGTKPGTTRTTERLEEAGGRSTPADPPPGEASQVRKHHVRLFQQEFRGASIVRFDPDRMRAPSPLLTEGQSTRLLNERGAGLAGVLLAILGRGNDDFTDLTRAVCTLFPMVKRIRVPVVSSDQVALEVQLTDGTIVPAAQMSEGLLYYIGFAALRFFAPVSLLLVEEPENGLHPSRIAEVMKVLRTISTEVGTQVVLATHSPLVVNELQPDEVSLVTRRSLEEGTRVTPIRDTPNFAKRHSVYSLGELWLSYADGIDESPLLEARPDVGKAAG
ncbi:MAG: ATP-binding protein [Deltaproteobacteria bacterium]|nr:ATP-binding protein [Deltaproteobacteria bacterium]